MTGHIYPWAPGFDPVLWVLTFMAQHDREPTPVQERVEEAGGADLGVKSDEADHDSR